MGLISKAAERFGRRGMPSPTWLVPGLKAAATAAEAEEAKHLTAAELAEQLLRDEYGEEAPPAPSSYSLAILRGMQGRAIYTGTVPAHVTAKRRAKNKAARKTRRLSRLRAR